MTFPLVQFYYSIPIEIGYTYFVKCHLSGAKCRIYDLKCHIEDIQTNKICSTTQKPHFMLSKLRIPTNFQT